jgi:hypothetical protein
MDSGPLPVFHRLILHRDFQAEEESENVITRLWVQMLEDILPYRFSDTLKR